MLDMEYSGNSFGVVEQGIIDVRLTYTRAINSLSSANINSTSITNATFIETGMLTAVVNEEAYDAIEFDLEIVYEGTETSDLLTVEGRVSNSADSDDWTVEVYNGTDWVSQTEVILGIGEDLEDDSVDSSTTVRFRISMPNVTSSEA